MDLVPPRIQLAPLARASPAGAAGISGEVLSLQRRRLTRRRPSCSVISERSTGRIYAHELSEADHLRLLEILTRMPAAQYSVLLCGYESPLYASLEPWRQIRHCVPTRGGLQDEMIWLNYPEPELLHDHRCVGRTWREGERIRRRQKTVTQMLPAMDPRERAAMLEAIVEVNNRSLQLSSIDRPY